MKVNGKSYRTIWMKEPDNSTVCIIDQRFLPHRFIIEEISSHNEMCKAISEMHLRGAGLIGVAAAYGMYLAVLECFGSPNFEDELKQKAKELIATRPTAVNLKHAVDKMLQAIKSAGNNAIKIAKQTALGIEQEDLNAGRLIGENGLSVIQGISKTKNEETVNILTHCNAGWLAFVDYGSALAPIYLAHKKGIKLHVWVDETRPRNQGAMLTAWELQNEGISHTIIADNTGGHLMQNGLIDMVITGADRIAANGDAANKIGTYLKALAAADNNIPFYIAAPTSSFDRSIKQGVGTIPVEQRNPDEVRYVTGWADNHWQSVLICPENSPAANYGFDVTPARLISGIITEKGICKANIDDICKIFDR
ncbi:MAG TPA: S-methyl-5-thioribose-1-phosphate isomerase [Tenuifilaceae bacterium]|nr:S-methyl-5-thioribose-1-phosphate isomerase [Tenuifilaceae bacterium]